MIFRIALVVLSLGLGACGSKFKEPLCAEAITALPEDFFGTFVANIPVFKNGEAQNGIESFNQTTIKISAEGISVPNDAPEIKSIFGLSNSSQLCRFKDKIFLQKLAEDGTYSLSRLQVTQYGISFSDLVLTSTLAAEIGLKSLKIPNVKVSSFQGEGWEEGSGFESGTVFLNKSIPQEVILDRAKYMYIQGHLQKISDAKTEKKWKLVSWSSAFKVP